MTVEPGGRCLTVGQHGPAIVGLGGAAGAAGITLLVAMRVLVFGWLADGLAATQQEAWTAA